MRKVTLPTTEPYSVYELLSALQADDLKLTFTGENNETVVFCTDTAAKDVLNRFRERLVLIATTTELTAAEKRAEFLALYNAWWTRRKNEFGRLMLALLKEYDPLSNYDRREEGKIIDTHDIGARSGTDNLTDSYDDTKRTITDTPGVTDTVTTEPDLTDTTTDTPRVVTTTTTTPGVVMTTDVGVYGDNSSTVAFLSSSISR